VFAEGVVLPEIGDLLLRHQARLARPRAAAEDGGQSSHELLAPPADEEAEDSTEMYSPEGNSTPSTDDESQDTAFR